HGDLGLESELFELLLQVVEVQRLVVDDEDSCRPIALIAHRRRKPSTRLRSARSSIGFGTNASQPDESASSRSPGITRELTATIGVAARSGFCLIARTASIPLISGSPMSIRIRSGCTA